MKYARVVDGRLVDVVDLSVYDPRPEWGQQDAALLDRIFAAVGGSASFIAVPDDAESGTFRNDDGSFESQADHEARLVAEEAAAVAATAEVDPPQ